MIVKDNVFELLCTNLYFLKSSSIKCQVKNEKIEDIDYTYLTILPKEENPVEVNNSRLTVGGRISGGREFIETKGILTEEEKKNLLTKFRGIIIGYPHYTLSVKLDNEKDLIECDVIKVKGGYKNLFPYFGYNEFAVEFISFSKDGKVRICKSLTNKDSDFTFEIKKINKVGQIMSIYSNSEYINPFLNPSDLSDFIYGVKTSYMGGPLMNGKKIKVILRMIQAFHI